MYIVSYSQLCWTWVCMCVCVCVCNICLVYVSYLHTNPSSWWLRTKELSFHNALQNDSILLLIYFKQWNYIECELNLIYRNAFNTNIHIHAVVGGVWSDSNVPTLSYSMLMFWVQNACNNMFRCLQVYVFIERFAYIYVSLVWYFYWVTIGMGNVNISHWLGHYHFPLSDFSRHFIASFNL